MVKIIMKFGLHPRRASSEYSKHFHQGVLCVVQRLGGNQRQPGIRGRTEVRLGQGQRREEAKNVISSHDKL